jgi:hypothetical protein
MAAENIQRFLQSFGDNVVRSSLGILNSKKGATELGSSLRVTVSEDLPDVYSVKFYMDDYGTFVDQGVSGNKTIRGYTNYKQNTVVSDYKYTTKQPPPTILEKWIKKKGIKGRDSKTGRYISNLSLAFIIGRSIKVKGIQGISFFQQPFGIQYEEMKEQFLTEFKKDIDTYLTTFTKF